MRRTTTRAPARNERPERMYKERGPRASGGPTPKGLDKIGIPASASEKVKLVAGRLKTTTPPRAEEEFVGPISRVERHADGDAGAVTVQATRNGHLAYVTVNVSPQRLDEAWTWARDRTDRVRAEPGAPD
jgi:hypothetical protein